MDIDLLKSATADDQMDMMLMMHNMDKSHSDIIVGSAPFLDSPVISFTDGGGTVSLERSKAAMTGGHHNNTMPQLFDSAGGGHLPNSSSPTLLRGGPQPTMSSFSNSFNPFGNNNNNNNNNNGSSLFPSSSTSSSSQKQTSMAAMREMIFRIAAMQPIYIDPESVKPPKRRNVRISKDPQSVAARHRRERISERIRILQRLVPGGTKMDTASMLDEAIHYVKFLKSQVQSLERAAINNNNRPLPMATAATGVGFPVAVSSGSSYFLIRDHSREHS